MAMKSTIVVINGMLPPELNINPSLALVRFGPGIVEVALRVSAIVLGLCVLISAGTADDHNIFRPNAGTRSIQFMIFLSLMIMLVETSILLVRFMNVKIINQYAAISFAVDTAISNVMFLALLISSSVALHTVNVNNLTQSTFVFSQAFSAAAILGIFLMLVFLALGLYMVLFNFKKWNSKVMQQLTADTEEASVIVDEP